MKQYENMQHGTKAFPVGIHDTICADGFALYPHIHREFEFLVMTEGRGTIYIENEKFEINKGEGIFINSEELHIGVKTNSEKAGFFAVVFAPEAFGNLELDKVVEKYVAPVLKNEVSVKRLLDKSVVTVLNKIHNEKSELLIKAYLYEAWNLLLEGAKKSDDLKNTNIEEIKTVMEYIRRNAEYEITLSDMANAINISRSYLCREFKKVVHMTPFEYLISVRIDKGCELLKNTDLSIGEISQSCGFNSFSYFTKIFGKKMHCSPKEYRQLNYKR